MSFDFKSCIVFARTEKKSKVASTESNYTYYCYPKDHFEKTYKLHIVKKKDKSKKPLYKLIFVEEVSKMDDINWQPLSCPLWSEEENGLIVTNRVFYPKNSEYVYEENAQNQEIADNISIVAIITL